MTSIEHGLLLDFSEADLHFCSTHGVSCGGWNPGDALNVVSTRGLIDEAEFPYMSAFDNPPQTEPGDGLWQPHCRPESPNRNAYALKITRSSTLFDMVERKNYLSNVGPCVAAFDVYEDFDHYNGWSLSSRYWKLPGWSLRRSDWLFGSRAVLDLQKLVGSYPVCACDGRLFQNRLRRVQDR